MLHGDFVESLEHQHLVYRYALTIDTLVNDLLTRVVTDMVASPAAFIFAHARRASTSASAAITTLQPLGLRDRGRVSAIGVRLQVEPQDLDTTIHDLSLDTARFGGRMCFKDGAFIIRLAVMGPTLTGVRDGRCHGCIGTHLYALFPRDTSTMAEDEEETSGGESESEDDTGEAEVARLLWPILTPSDSRPRPNARRARPTSTAEVAVLRDIPLARRAAPAPLARRSRTRSLSPEISFSLPPRIWSNDENSTYHPHPSGDFGPHRFFDSVCRAAARGRAPVPPVVIRGPDVDALVDSFNDALDAAGRRNDYSEILTVVYALTTGRAVGDGVRREVITAALQRYLTEETSWFQRGEEEVLTLRTLFPVTSSSLLVPASRLLGFKRLGAICALHHIFGQSPDSISPAIFQYIIHRCNLDAITPAFTSEWFPELSHLLRTFLETSETGDLRPFQTHFVSFHGVEVSAFRTRDLATHQGLAVNMLFKPTIANNTFEHPELQSFRLGYLFRCGANDAFDLPYAIRNFEGGSEPFLSLVATSSISSADSVLGLLDVANPPNLVVHITALRDITGDMTLTFDMVFERFLRTVGLPCPQMFEARRGAFHRMIDLSEESINKPAFRPRIVVWALTGSPSIDSTAGHRISLGPINTHGEGYGGPDLAADERDLLASVGTFHLATCHRTVRYPVEHVLRLAQAQYVPEGEPGDFQEAFDFWFLYQCLIAIGRYNIV
ncbi:hypothetical protein K438DRAFT_1861757 [Mycena galopus ATCC 62051]|nr:hypothetical protein K438DRAFT_1861757 [Mycena galopus ATCC 62051]